MREKATWFWMRFIDVRSAFLCASRRVNVEYVVYKEPKPEEPAAEPAAVDPAAAAAGRTEL